MRGHIYDQLLLSRAMNRVCLEDTNFKKEDFIKLSQLSMSMGSFTLMEKLNRTKDGPLHHCPHSRDFICSVDSSLAMTALASPTLPLTGSPADLETRQSPESSTKTPCNSPLLFGYFCGSSCLCIAFILDLVLLARNESSSYFLKKEGKVCEFF